MAAQIVKPYPSSASI